MAESIGNLRVEETEDYLFSPDYHIENGRIYKGRKENWDKIDIYERPDVQRALRSGKKVILAKVKMPVSAIREPL